jgi:hypothetical protein
MLILHMRREQTFKFNQNIKFLFVHLRPVFDPLDFFETLSLLKSPGIVESEHFFLCILLSFWVFGEYAESILVYMENTANLRLFTVHKSSLITRKESMRTWRRQKEKQN